MNLWEYKGTDWAGMICAVVSLYYLAKHRKIGFVFAIIGNLSWMAFALMAESVANIISNFIYLGFNIHCWRKWKQDQSTCPQR